MDSSEARDEPETNEITLEDKFKPYIPVAQIITSQPGADTSKSQEDHSSQASISFKNDSFGANKPRSIFYENDVMREIREKIGQSVKP